MSDNPIPFSEWEKQGNTYPTKNVLYSWTRPGSVRDELIEAGVITKINDRWLINPSIWRSHCANKLRKP